MTRSGPFLLGVFTIAAAILALQILQTRLVSVMSWYFLAFFAISMAMFGMTAGALLAYFHDDRFSRELLMQRLAQLSIGFAIAIAVSALFLITTLTYTDYGSPLLTVLVWSKMVMALAPPYVFGGMVISLALTRSPFPVGTVYAVDLMGAAFGCFAVLGLMSVVDGVSALFAVAALGGVSAVLFLGAVPGSRRRGSVIATVLLLLVAAFNAAVYPEGARVFFTKNKIEAREHIDGVFWNSFSRILVAPPRVTRPFFWGPSPKVDVADLASLEQRPMNIDGAAGTTMYSYAGDRDTLAFLEYDITNLAYTIRHAGRAAVIGVGGGRDVLAAHYFGFESITGVEINDIFVRNLTGRYADFNRIASVEGVRLITEEARSWFARTDQTFDLIQMSLIDTFAATGAGAFSLTENGLYTIESWGHFLGRLTEGGVFTVSRWYAPDSPGETGRLISLAKAALIALGVERPNEHIYLAATGRLATVIVSRAPLAGADLERLDAAAERLEYDVLFAPRVRRPDAVLAAVYDAETMDDLLALGDSSALDYSPPTDARPFFFNQIRLRALFTLSPLAESVGGVISGNLVATGVLVIIILVSAGAALLTIVLPTLPMARRVAPGLAGYGTAYFFLIGLGFMFVEIGLMQRLSIFLGHPVYGLAVALFGIILSTGLGSALSERAPLTGQGRLAGWALGTGTYFASLPFWFPDLLAAFAGSGILVRAAVCLAAVAPGGIALGFGFPTGMRLVNAIDERPTPWFWAVNGAAGVLASGLAVATGIFVSIDASLWCGASCYLLLWPVALGLKALDAQTVPEALSR